MDKYAVAFLQRRLCPLSPHIYSRSELLKLANEWKGGATQASPTSETAMSVEKHDDVDATRRSIVRGIAAGGVWTGVAFAGGAIGGVSGELGKRIFFSLFDSDPDQRADNGALVYLLGKDTHLPSIYAGEGNAIGQALGTEGLSVYLRYSARQFSSFVASASEVDVVVAKTNIDSVFQYARDRPAIFLGSPSANSITSRLLGYRRIDVAHGEKTIQMDTPDISDRRTRWCQVYGETGYGVFAGKSHTAARYSSSTGNLVERPVYRLLDKSTGKIIVPRVSGGFLMEDWLTVVRLKDHDTYKVIIGGMHGYSTEAFARGISDNIGQIESIVGATEEYQLVVPVVLSHDADLMQRVRTTGHIDWSSAIAHGIER